MYSSEVGLVLHTPSAVKPSVFFLARLINTSDFSDYYLDLNLFLFCIEKVKAATVFALLTSSAKDS